MYLVSRTETFAKLFFIVSFTGLFMYIALAFYSFHTAYSTVSQVVRYQEQVSRLKITPLVGLPSFKYILMWTLDGLHGVNIQEQNQIPLMKFDCPNVSCYITTNKSVLNGNYTNFDAIVFNHSSIKVWKKSYLPQYRSPHQKYVFYSKLPSNNHPLCNVALNNCFNWTWTYKITSDVFSPFIEVRKRNSYIVAPRFNVVWKSEYAFKKANSVDEVTTKTKAVGLILSNCTDKNKAITIKKLQFALQDHSLDLDVFGCDYKECPKEGCLAAIKKTYFFYLVYEDSISDDYVTEEVLKAYNHDAVPIIIGGADYTKFLPDNSYILFDGSAEKVAAQVAFAMSKLSVYRGYFVWKRSYTIHKADEKKGLCQLCENINNRLLFESFSTYEHFLKWWFHGNLNEKCHTHGNESSINHGAVHTNRTNNTIFYDYNDY